MSYRLSEDFIKGNIKKESLRKAFGRSLTDVAKQNRNIVALAADLAGSVGLGDFEAELPGQYIETGIAEQNLVTVASGIAHVGKIPFAASYAAFNPGRNWEQIRTTVALNDVPVKIVATHAGLNVGPDGATHQMLEDIALMRVIPNMVVLAPGDAIEASKMAAAMASDERPNYIRLPRAEFPTFSVPDDKFEIGRAYLLHQDDGAAVSIIATGSMTGNALLAAQKLYDKGIPSEVVHVPTIKPLDRETILGSVGRTSITVTVEEHQIAGGLGSAVAEAVLEAGVYPTKFCRIGVDDKFGQSGTCDELLSHYGLDVDSIVRKIVALFDH